MNYSSQSKQNFSYFLLTPYAVFMLMTTLLTPYAVFMLMGDHGMTDGGDHGGATREETTSGLFVFHKAATRGTRGSSSWAGGGGCEGNRGGGGGGGGVESSSDSSHSESQCSSSSSSSGGGGDDDDGGDGSARVRSDDLRAVRQISQIDLVSVVECG